MKITTIGRILLGGAIILSCAVVPLWIAGSSSPSTVEKNIFVLPPDMSGPYNAVSPAAVWLYQQEFGSLSHGLDTVKLGSPDAGKGRSLLLLRVDRARILPNQGPANPYSVIRYLRALVKNKEMKAVIFPIPGKEKDFIKGENHLFLPVIAVSDPENFQSLFEEALPGIVRVLFAEKWYQIRSPAQGGSLKKTLSCIDGASPYHTINSKSSVVADSKWIGIRSDRYGDVIPMLNAVPLAGKSRDVSWLARGGFRAVAPDSLTDLGSALQKGAVSAGLLWKVPEGVPFARLPVSGSLGVIFNMRSVAALRLQRILKLQKVKTGEKWGDRVHPSSSGTIRLLCRQSEGVSRARALELAQEWEKYGVRTAVELVNDSDFRSRLSKRNFDAVLAVFPVFVASNLRYWWNSTSPGNISGYGSPYVDSLLDQLRGTEKDKEILNGIRNILIENGAWMELELVGLKLCGSRPALRRLGFPATR